MRIKRIKSALVVALVLLAACFLITGCALAPAPQKPTAFSRASTTFETFLADRFACIHEAGTGAPYVACMETKGYRPDSAGFHPPG